jgi:glycosyltransferase involved in cell wall biosynthesis
LKIAMFVFNPARRDPRVEREASLLAEHGHEVRVFAHLEPGIPVTEERSGYTIVRTDQRPPVPRAVDEFILNPLKRVLRPWKSSETSSQPPSQEEVPSPPNRAAERPCSAPAGRNLPAEASAEERRFLGYINRINKIWASQAIRWGPDVVHSHDLDTLMAGVETSEATGARLVYDAHELWSEQQFLASMEMVDYWDDLERRLVRRADAVIAVSDARAGEMERRYHISPVQVLLNCPRLTDTKAELRGTLRGRSDGRPVALFIGGYFHERGLEEFIASSLLQTKVQIALQGYGPFEGRLRQLAEAWDAPVIFLEPASHSAMVDACCQADIGVIPYPPTCLNNYLCAPNKVYDYMMAGIPVAGSDLPDLRDLILAESMGGLFDPRSPDDIARCLVELADEEKLKTMGQRARQAAERAYHWEKEGQKLLELYRRLTSPR